MARPALDSRATYDALDPSGLYGRIAGLPGQIEEAFARARALRLPAAYRDVERTVVAGMGGSAIGGGLLRGLAHDLGARAPFDVVRGYTVPGWVDERTLVIASSNSGNTEETVAALRQAIAARARCVVVAAGGKLAAIAQQHRIPALLFEWEGEPRSALGWSFASLLALAGKLRLAPDLRAELPAACAYMATVAAACARDVDESRNPAKQLAARLAGKLPVVVGAGCLGPVAYRWKTQLNENGKSWAFAAELPELNHNAPVGYGAPAALLPLLHVVLLRHAAMHPRVALRVDATAAQLAEAGVGCEVIEVPGPTAFAQMLWAIQLGDLASYYAGILNGADPSEVAALDWLKAYLAARP
jgi:glucose/mannose-6-phosphate isomerase